MGSDVSSVPFAKQTTGRGYRAIDSVSSYSGTRLGSSAADEEENVVVVEEDGPAELNVRAAAITVAGQSALIALSVAVGSLAGIPNRGLGAAFSYDAGALLRGVTAAAPLFALAVVLDVVERRFDARALRDVSRATQRSVLYVLGPRLRPLAALVVSAALAAAAGIGEEALFRGLLQADLSTRFGSMVAADVGVAAAVAFTSVIFGALHAVTPLYAALATLASVYFGWLYVDAGTNLVVPITAHAVYDLGALLWAHYVVTCRLDDDERASIWRGEDAATAAANREP